MATNKKQSKPTAKKSTSKTTPISQDRKWEVENAISTLTRAEQIRQDSKLMSDVKKQLSAMNNSILKRK